MRAILEEIETPTLGPNKRPVRVVWRGRTYRVEQVRDEWEAGGRWWLGEPDRFYFALKAGHVWLEIYRELGGARRWVMSRLQD